MNKTTISRLAPYIAAVVLVMVFVSMGVWIRLMSDSFSTWQQAYLRVFLAGLLAIVVFRKSLSWKFVRGVQGHDWMVYVVRGLVSYVVGVGFFTIAIQNAPFSVVSFVSSLPVLGLLAWVMFREKVRLGTLPFIGLSVVGLVLITGVDLRDFHLGWGETAAIIALLGFDIGFMMARLHPKKFSNYQNTTLLLLVGWVPLFAVSMWLHEPIVPSHVSAGAWVGLAVSSILNVAALYLINYVFGHLKAYVAGNILLLEGVFALAIGLVLYNEVPSMTMLAGAAIIMACAYAVSFIDRRADRIEAAQSELGTEARA